MTDHVDVYVKDTSVTIVHRGQTVVEFCVQPGKDGAGKRGHVCIPLTAQESNTWETTTALEREPLVVDIVTYEKEGPMALTRIDRNRASTRTIKPDKNKKNTRSAPSNADSITGTPKADQVLRHILKSLKANPNQSKADISAESHRIAAKCGVGVMAVAGVRANLSRGRYGNPKKLIAEA